MRSEQKYAQRKMHWGSAKCAGGAQNTLSAKCARTFKNVNYKSVFLDIVKRRSGFKNTGVLKKETYIHNDHDSHCYKFIRVVVSREDI